MSTCRINIFEDEDEESQVYFRGGIKLNFNFNDHVLIENYIKIDAKHSEKFITEFCFSNKSIFIASLSSKETGKKWNKKVKELKFKYLLLGSTCFAGTS